MNEAVKAKTWQSMSFDAAFGEMKPCKSRIEREKEEALANAALRE